MHSLTQTLDIFNDYLQGDSSSVLKNHMRYYNNRYMELNENFHHLHIDSIEIKPNIEKILQSLVIPERQWGRYFQSNLTVYDFLQELNKEEYIQVEYLLGLIDTKKKMRKWDTFFGTLFILCILAGILTTPIFFPISVLVNILLTSPLTLPISGLILSAVTASFSLYSNYFNKNKTFFNRFRDNAFALTYAFLNFLGNGVWMANSTVMTPMIAGIFVAVSALDALKELFCLAQEIFRHRQNPPHYEEEELNKNRRFARYEFSYKKHRNAMIINLMAAIALTGIMGVGCFASGGIFFVTSILVAIVGVHTGKFFALRKNDKMIRDQLQEKLRNLEIISPNVLSEEQSNSIVFVREDEELSMDSKVIFFNDRPRIAPRGIDLPFFKKKSSSERRNSSLSSSLSNEIMCTNQTLF